MSNQPVEFTPDNIAAGQVEWWQIAEYFGYKVTSINHPEPTLDRLALKPGEIMWEPFPIDSFEALLEHAPDIRELEFDVCVCGLHCDFGVRIEKPFDAEFATDFWADRYTSSSLFHAALAAYVAVRQSQGGEG